LRKAGRADEGDETSGQPIAAETVVGGFQDILVSKADVVQILVYWGNGISAHAGRPQGCSF
jgi:hypothetical protein